MGITTGYWLHTSCYYDEYNHATTPLPNEMLEAYHEGYVIRTRHDGDITMYVIGEREKSYVV